MLTSAIVCAYQDPKKPQATTQPPATTGPDGTTTEQEKAPPAHPPLPDTLAGWAE